jgi:hypothetical protein
MPEAAIDEHRDPSPGEDDVSPPSETCEWRVVDAVAKAARVEESADRNFRTSIS